VHNLIGQISQSGLVSRQRYKNKGMAFARMHAVAVINWKDSDSLKKLHHDNIGRPMG
jgi:hypothetical protein